MLNIQDSISLIKGIGDKKAERLNSIGIFTVEDMLKHYPYRYSDRRKVVLSQNASLDKPSLVEGKLIKLQTRRIGNRRLIVECVFKDDSGTFSVSFFNMPFLSKTLLTGKNYTVYGQMRLRNGLKIFTNPEIAELGSDKDKRGIIPIYHCTAGITNNDFYKWIKYILNDVSLENDWLDADILSKNKLCDIQFALQNIHFPDSEQHYKTSLYRLVYDELLLYQLAIRLTRRDINDECIDSSIEDIDISPFIDSLGFLPTNGQIKAIQEIERDLIARKPMNRLVQGDVGCGKTLVAESGIYKCIKSGCQAAFMAPTEILARQHFQKLSRDFEKFGFKSVLLISGIKSSERKELLERISTGDIDLVVGTHAIIQDDVEFKNLGIAITDEQHRFGVNQRKSLMTKSKLANICVMSATPIPRTLAATVFGDMDFSIITDKPQNRLEIITRCVSEESRERAYIILEKEIKSGHQAYVVAPSINSDDEDLSSVEELLMELQKKFKDFKVELIHGKLDKEIKDKIMNDFASGKIDVLVSTTVIEVGIDVPNATIIVIENSERYGLAQMHQLRGRVGRSKYQSYCYLVNYGKSEAALNRADALVKISDGFEISEIDYQMRGPGDLMGTMQSGNFQAHILSLCRHQDILDLAINDANSIIEKSMEKPIKYARNYINNIYSNYSNVI